MNANELTYFEVVEIWAAFANGVETSQSIEKSMNSESYSGRVREQEATLAKLVEIKKAKLNELFGI